MHRRSLSPTGKFGFHISTCHAKIAQAVDTWEDSWCALYSKHLGHVMNLAKPILNWPEFDIVCKLTLEIVVPRLLLPLQSDGRVLKPCLIHGDCWDGNTAMDMRTGEAFVFDVCSFYGHNEYDIGNWRAPRHRLSSKVYVRNYKRHYPVSEPGTASLSSCHRNARADCHRIVQQKIGTHAIFSILSLLILVTPSIFLDQAKNRCKFAILLQVIVVIPSPFSIY